MIDSKEIESGLVYVLPFLRMDDKQRNSYIAALTLKFGWMNAYAWSETCKVVGESMTNGRVPAVLNYKTAFEAVKPRMPEGEVRKCSGCDGERFTFGFVKRKADGWIYEAVTPCARCNPIVLDAKRASDFRSQFEVSTKTAHAEQRQRIWDEAEARAVARRLAAPKVIEAIDYRISEPARNAVESKAVTPVEPATMEKALAGAMTAPAPKHEEDGWITSE